MPPAPVTVDLATISGPWPGFVVSGFSGSYLEFNGTYVLLAAEDNDARQWKMVDSVQRVARDEGGLWNFPEGAFPNAQSDDEAVFAWPWMVTGWQGTGTPVFARYTPPPASVALDGATPTLQATMITSLTGTNNDLSYTAVPAGRLGNWIIVRYIAPGTNNAVLGVVVAGLVITVNLATNGSAQITTTAAQIKTAIEASAAASALVTVANAAGNNGSGVVTAMADQDLADGEGGLPNPPVTVTI
jgi:hypothetical protein